MMKGGFTHRFGDLNVEFSCRTRFIKTSLGEHHEINGSGDLLEGQTEATSSNNKAKQLVIESDTHLSPWK